MNDTKKYTIPTIAQLENINTGETTTIHRHHSEANSDPDYNALLRDLTRQLRFSTMSKEPTFGCKDEIWFLPREVQGTDPVPPPLSCIFGHKDHESTALLALTVVPAWPPGSIPIISQTTPGPHKTVLSPTDPKMQEIRILTLHVAWAWLDMQARLDPIREEARETALRLAGKQIEEGTLPNKAKLDALRETLKRRQHTDIGHLGFDSADLDKAPPTTTERETHPTTETAKQRKRIQKGCLAATLLWPLLTAGILATPIAPENTTSKRPNHKPRSPHNT